MNGETAATGSIPDPLETLAEALQREIEKVLARGSGEYEQGVVAGLAPVGELVEREQRHMQAIHDEHVPGRVYGPLDG